MDQLVQKAREELKKPCSFEPQRAVIETYMWFNNSVLWLHAQSEKLNAFVTFGQQEIVFVANTPLVARDGTNKTAVDWFSEAANLIRLCVIQWWKP